jgi:GntR family transcriptional regulator
MKKVPNPSKTSQQLADELQAAIAAGTYSPGDKLPTERALAESMAVHRNTAHEALKILCRRGVAIAHQGRGTYVRSNAVLHRQGIDRYAKSRWRGKKAAPILGTEASQQGISARRLIREISNITPPTDVQERLQLPKSQKVLVRRRTIFLGQRPSQLADSYYPLSVVGRTRLHLDEPQSASDFAQLDSAGFTPERIREEWTSRMPTTPEVKELKMAEGTPVIFLIRTIFGPDDLPIEVMISTIAADMTAIVYDFPIPD